LIKTSHIKIPESLTDDSLSSYSSKPKSTKGNQLRRSVEKKTISDQEMTMVEGYSSLHLIREEEIKGGKDIKGPLNPYL